MNTFQEILIYNHLNNKHGEILMLLKTRSLLFSVILELIIICLPCQFYLPQSLPDFSTAAASYDYKAWLLVIAGTTVYGAAAAIMLANLTASAFTCNIFNKI